MPVNFMPVSMLIMSSISPEKDKITVLYSTVKKNSTAEP